MQRSTITTALRVTASLSAIAGFGLLATGCGLKKTPTTTKASVAQVRVWRVGQSSDLIKDLARDFQTTNKNAVQVTYKRKNATDYELASLKSLAARNGPDVWSLPSDWLWDHQERVVAVPDTFYVDSKTKKGDSPLATVKTLYPEGIWKQIVGTDDKVYGLPSSVEVLSLYYNQDVVAQALAEYKVSLGKPVDEAKYAEAKQKLKRPPQTWNELLEMEKFITTITNGQPTRSTIALGAANNIPNPDAVVQLLMLQNGAKIVSTDRQSALFQVETVTPIGGHVNPGINAIEFFASFSKPDKENYTWNPSMSSALDAFGQGKLAMVLGFGDFGQKLTTKYPKFKYTVEPVPQISVDPLSDGADLIRFSVETVTKTANNTGYAFSFLKQYTASGSTNSLSRDLKQYSPYLKILESRKTDFPYKQILNGQAVYKKEHTLFDEAFVTMLTDVTQNGISPSDAILTAAETIKQFLDPSYAETN